MVITRAKPKHREKDRDVSNLRRDFVDDRLSNHAV
jgi:hypothetical protein